MDKGNTDPDLEHRTQLLRALIEQTSRDDLGLPLGIYRADLLPDPVLLSVASDVHAHTTDERLSRPVDVLTPTPRANLTDEPTLFDLTPPSPSSGSDPGFEQEQQLDLFEPESISEPKSTSDTGVALSKGNGKRSSDGNGALQLASHAPQASHQGYHVVIADKYAVDSRQLAAAYVHLNHEEGFPALPNGTPFWEQFDFEPAMEYEVFQTYLGQEGARQLSLVPQPSEWYNEDKSPSNGKASTNGSSAKLREVSTMYYWALRAKAYDLFREADLRRKRAQRIMTMEDDHYIKATKLLEQCELYIAGDEFPELINPKTAIDGLRAGAQLQRVALGLPAQGPPAKDGDELPKDQVPPIEVVMHSRARKFGTSKTEVDAQEDTAISQILQDPDAVEQAQELIIRINSK